MRGRSWRGASCLAWTLLLSAALPHAAARGEPARGGDAIYGYTDDHGRLVYVQSLEEIPPRLRRHARRADVADEPSLLDLVGDRLTSEPVLYRYRASDGSIKFTNLPETVPAAQRATAKLDLSRVSLNSDIGRDLQQRLQAEHERLVHEPVCQQLQAAASKPFYRVIWDEHGPLVVCATAILLMVLLTPAMLRRAGREWARALTMGIPVLALAGLFAYATIRSTRSLAELKAAAAPCDATAWNAVASQDRGLIKQLQLLQGLRVQQAGLEQIAREGR